MEMTSVDVISDTNSSGRSMPTCAICGTKTEDIILIEEYEDDMEHEVALRDKLLALSGNKELPPGRICKNCMWRAKDAWEFQQQLQTLNQEPTLSDKIRILRHRLKQLTQKMDVFIVVGPETNNESTDNVRYSEDNVIMVDKNLPDDPFLDELEAESLLECSICPDNFNNDLELAEHIKIHPPGATHLCSICKLGFSSRHQLLSHKLRHKLKDTRECPKCLTVLKTAYELTQHTCQILCLACPNVFDNRVQLSKHIRKNHGVASQDSPYACPICFKVFKTVNELEIHSGTHRQTNQYVCGHDGCVKRFSTRNDVLSHINETHFKVQNILETQEVKVEFECSICQRTFNSERSMKIHETRLHKTIKRRRGRPTGTSSSVKAAENQLSVSDPLEEIYVKRIEPFKEENVEILETETNRGLQEESLDDDDFQMLYVEVDEDLPEDIEYINGEITTNISDDQN